MIRKINLGYDRTIQDYAEKKISVMAALCDYFSSFQYETPHEIKVMRGHTASLELKSLNVLSHLVTNFFDKFYYTKQVHVLPDVSFCQKLYSGRYVLICGFRYNWEYLREYRQLL